MYAMILHIQDDGPTPAKKAKEQDVKAANPTAKKRKTSRRKKCTYWDKCFRKEATHLKTFRHPDDSKSLLIKRIVKISQLESVLK